MEPGGIRCGVSEDAGGGCEGPEWHFKGDDDFWPEVGVHEGRSVIALLDQGLLIYEEDDVIHPATLISGSLSSDLLEEDTPDGDIYGWTVDTIDGRYDLGSVIVCWKWEGS